MYLEETTKVKCRKWCTVFQGYWCIFTFSPGIIKQSRRLIIGEVQRWRWNGVSIGLFVLFWRDIMYFLFRYVHDIRWLISLQKDHTGNFSSVRQLSVSKLIKMSFLSRKHTFILALTSRCFPTWKNKRNMNLRSARLRKTIGEGLIFSEKTEFSPQQTRHGRSVCEEKKLEINAWLSNSSHMSAPFRHIERYFYLWKWSKSNHLFEL